MYSPPQKAIQWVKYFIHASNGRGHGIHSPFVYDLIREVLNDNRIYYAYKNIETLKYQLLLDHRVINVQDLGAGISMNTKLRKISTIAGQSVSSQKFGRLLFRLANYYRSKTIVELGSSLGISTAYLAASDPGATIYTIEGSAEVATIAKENFERLGLTNTNLVNLPFKDALGSNLINGLQPDLVFIDGNHRLMPVKEYFSYFLEKISANSLIVVHDIHWSNEMEMAWNWIRNHPCVKMTIDIYSAGLVFFRDEFKVKQDFLIRF